MFFTYSQKTAKIHTGSNNYVVSGAHDDCSYSLLFAQETADYHSMGMNAKRVKKCTETIKGNETMHV